MWCDLSMELGKQSHIGSCTVCTVACSDNEFIEITFVLKDCMVN